MTIEPIYAKRPVVNKARYNIPVRDVKFIVAVTTSKDPYADTDNPDIYVRIHGINGSTKMLQLNNAAQHKAHLFGEDNKVNLGGAGAMNSMGETSNKFEKGDVNAFLFQADDEDVDDVGTPLAIDVAIGSPTGANGKSVDGWKYKAIVVWRYTPGADIMQYVNSLWEDQKIQTPSALGDFAVFTHPAWMDEKLGQTMRYVWRDLLRNVEPAIETVPSVVSRTWAILDNRGGITGAKPEKIDIDQTYVLTLSELHNALKKTHNEVEVSISSSEEFAGSKFAESVKATTSTDKETQKQRAATAAFTADFKQSIEVQSGYLKIVEIAYTSTNSSQVWVVGEQSVSNVVPQALAPVRQVWNFKKGASIPDDIAIILKDSGVPVVV